MLSGKKVFGGETITDALAAVVRGEPDWSLLPANTPPAMRSLLQRCLKKEVKQRLQAIGDARIIIEETISGGSSPFASHEEGGTQDCWPVVLSETSMRRLFAHTITWRLPSIFRRSSVLSSGLLSASFLTCSGVRLSS
jgi:hypothetical protein